MSSTPIPSSASRAQSANNKTNEVLSKDSNNVVSVSEKLFRPPSVQKSTINSTDKGISSDPHVVSNTENLLPKVSANDRPSSASKQSVITSTIGTRPGSTTKNLNAEPILTSTVTNSRPTSANRVQDSVVTNNITTDKTNVRPPSANNKTKDITTGEPVVVTAGSRPLSANQKQNDINLNSSMTTLSISRPTSANNKQEEPTADNNLNDPALTEPIIGRPLSASTLRKASIVSSSGIAALAAIIPLNFLTSNDDTQVPNSTKLPPTTS